MYTRGQSVEFDANKHLTLNVDRDSVYLGDGAIVHPFETIRLYGYVLQQFCNMYVVACNATCPSLASLLTDKNLES